MRTELLEHLQKKKRYIIVPIMLLVVIILVVVSGTVYTRKLTITRMKESLHDQVQNQTTAMKDKIEGKMSLLGGLAVTITEQELTDYYAMIEKTGVFEKKTDFSEIAFITADARVYSNTGETWVLSDKKHFYSCMNGSYEIDKLKEHGRENDIGIFVPIRVNNRISGVLLGIYPQEKFQELFQETGAGISDVSYIIDFGEGLVVKTDAAEPWESIAEQISKEQSGDISYSLDGEQRYGALEPIGMNNWYVLTVLREKVIYQKSSENMRIFSYMLSVILAAGIGITVYLVFTEHRQEKQAREEAEEMRYVLEHDDMTGVLTEREFQNRVRQRLLDAEAKEYCIIYLDIFKFKLVNEMFGYEKGDRLLKVLARELDHLTAENDWLCGRISGDKFILFLPYDRTLLQVFSTRKEVMPRILPIELYLHYGIYIIEKTQLPVAAMIDCAHIAQKTVKGNYDNYIAWYDEKLKQQIIREQEIINSMAQALADGEFTIYLQPQYCYRDRMIHGCEALVRWISPAKGIISPGDFIPLFERNGFIIKLDENVWEQACALLQKWIKEGKEPLPISINVSRADLLRGNVSAKLKSLIRKYGLTTDLLHVEITESAYMDNPQKLILEINQLKEEGFLVEMDDFGSGYSSLNMLKDLPINVLKTDLKFLDNKGIAERREQILDSVIKMAHEMGLTVVAEGVETKEQAEHLNRLDCEIMQGYYFAKPVPVSEFEQLAYGTLEKT